MRVFICLRIPRFYTDSALSNFHVFRVFHGIRGNLFLKYKGYLAAYPIYHAWTPILRTPGRLSIFTPGRLYLYAWSPIFVILKVVHKLSRVPFTLFPEPPYVIRVISRIPRGEIRGIRGTTRVKYSTDSAKKKHGSVFVLFRDG